MAEGSLQVTTTPADQGVQPITGALTFVDNMVDATTDTIKLKATFTNSDRLLWPGQFNRVSMRLTTIKLATIVPSQAVQTGQNGLYVFVVKPDSTVEMRTVTTGETLDQDTVIQKGLQVGETVVTEGQLRLEPGTRVRPQGRGGRGPT